MEPHNGIAGQDRQGLGGAGPGRAGFPAPCPGFGPAPGIQAARRVPHPVRGAGDQAPDHMRQAPLRLDARGRPKPAARPRKTRPPRPRPTQPLVLFACDTVVRLHAGLQRYVFTFLDPYSRFALAWATATASSRHAAVGLEALCTLLPTPPQFLLSANGAEFHGHFQQRLDAYGITHWWTYPRSPKMNAHVERFNRTLQEQFVDYHEDLLVDDLAAFNRKLADWLLAYNTVLPHHSLGRQSPVQFLIHHQPECQMWWTHTEGCISDAAYAECVLHTPQQDETPSCCCSWAGVGRTF